MFCQVFFQEHRRPALNNIFTFGQDFFYRSSAILIESEVAASYKTAHAQPVPVPEPDTTTNADGSTAAPVANTNGTGGASQAGAGTQAGGQPKKQYKRFFGTIALDSVTGTMQLQNVMQELVSLFTTKPGVEVSLKLDIEASSPTPFDDSTIRAAKENSVVLKLETADFCEE